MWPVEVEVRETPGVPPPTGAHELAWARLLDRVFADAFHAGLGSLVCTLPRSELAEAVRLRAELARPPVTAEGSGVALLAGGCAPLPRARRLYTLEAASPASRPLRRALPPVNALAGWRLVGTLGLYGWGPRLLGVPVRAAGVLRNPRLADRAMRAVLTGFERAGAGSATYRLRVWAPA